MRLSSGLLFTAVPALAHYQESSPHHHPHHPTHVSHREQEALMDVENVCKVEIETQCRPPEETHADPLFQWFLAPERLAPPPVFHPAADDPLDPSNIGMLIDHMMDTALQMPMMVQPQEPVFFLFVDYDDAEQQQPEEAAPVEQAFDSMVTKLMQHGTNCDKHKQVQKAEGRVDPDELHHHLRLKGEEVLKQEDVPDERRRLARRLTEISPEEYIARATQHHPMFNNEHHHDHHGHNHDHHGDHLCPRKLQCLMQAKEQSKVSPICSDALTRLEKVHTEDAKAMEEMAVYMSMFWFYCLLCVCLFTMIFLCRKWKANKKLFWLRLKVLQAVYSNPEIKAKVEDELGGDIGAVPPVGRVSLQMMSARGREECRARRNRFYTIGTIMLMIFTLDTFGYLPESWPFVFMGTACVFIIFRMGTLFFAKPPVRECSCCCCGGSTLDVEEGRMSDAQACCTCCKGTGICAVKCSSCCGIATDGKGCCGGSCGCGNGSGCDGSCGCCGCTCCCCGLTTQDVTKGHVSDVQACCNCCKGTGVCSANCKACCGPSDGSSCDCCDGKDCDCCSSSSNQACSKKKPVGSNMVVYEGVPIQVV